MFAFRDVIELEKVAAPVPSFVLELAIVGLAVVLQHTPLAVTLELPSSTIVPPPLAVVIEVTIVVVVRIGIAAAPVLVAGFIQADPLYSCNSPLGPQLVQKTIIPAVGLAIVAR